MLKSIDSNDAQTGELLRNAGTIYTVGSKRTENQCHMYCISVPKVLDISDMH